MVKNQKRLILIEFEDELDSFLKCFDKNYLVSSESCIVAIEPEAQSKLKHLKIPYQNSFHFFGKHGHESCLKFSDKVINTIRNNLNIRDHLNIKEGYHNTLIFYLRFVLHNCLFLIEVLDQAVKTHEPKKIYYPQSSFNFLELHLTGAERFLGEIVHQYCKKAGIDSIQFGNSKKQKYQIQPLKKIKQIGIEFYFQIMLLYYGKKSNSSVPILGVDKSYNLSTFIGSLQKKLFPSFQAYLGANNILNDIRRMFIDSNYLTFLSLPKRLPLKQRNLFNEILQYNKKKIYAIFDDDYNLLRYRGVNLRSIFERYFENAIVPRLLEIHGQAKNIDKIFNKRKPGLVISQKSFRLGTILGELCIRHDVSSLLISHGSHVPPKNEFELIEWREHGLGLMNTCYKHLAVQTPWAKKYLDFFPSKSKILITGPLIIANKTNFLQNKIELKNHLLPNVKQKFIILHAGTPKKRTGRRFYVYETVDEYIENINSIIRVVRKLKDLYLVVRFRSSSDFQLEDLNSLLEKSDNFGIYCENTFQEFLSISDLLISYSSTTIEEALQNRVPVLQYDPHGKYCHVPCQVLSRDKKPNPDSCYFIGSEEDLEWGLSWILENLLQKIKVPDSAWAQHMFSDNEIENILEHIKDIFEYN